MPIAPSVTQGSAFADGVRVGTVRGGPTNINTGTAQNPVYVPAAYPTFDNGAPGIPLGIDYPYIITPLAASATNLFPAAAIAQAGPLTLTAGAGVVVDTTTFQGYTAYDLGVARTLTFTGVNTVNAVTFTISGWDLWGAKVVETTTLALGANTNNTSNKTMRWIHSIQASGPTGGGTAAIGTSNEFGLPYYVPNQSYILPVWDGVPDYKWAAGPAVMQLQGVFAVGDATFPATATTADVRGIYETNPADLPDGTKKLVIRILMPLVDPIYTRGTSVPTKNAYGVPQYNTGWL